MPLAVVLGDLDLVSCLGMAGVGCVPVALPENIVHFSRFNRTTIETPTAETSDELVERLRSFAKAQAYRPVLYYQDDDQLLLVSRRRATLREYYRFVLPEQELVENLVDKVRFRALAERLELPVPRSRVLCPHDHEPDTSELVFPLLLKPSTRQGLAASPGKARR